MATTKRVQKGLFANDLRALLYAFGDSPQPDSATIDALEDVLTEYIEDICHEAARVAKIRGRQPTTSTTTTNTTTSSSGGSGINKVKVDDFRFILRDDPAKLARVDQLLAMHKEIVKAKKMFDNDEDVKTLTKSVNPPPGGGGGGVAKQQKDDKNVNK